MDSFIGRAVSARYFEERAAKCIKGARPRRCLAVVRKGGSLIYRRRKGPVIGAERITNKMEYSTGSGPAVSAGPGVICCVPRSGVCRNCFGVHSAEDKMVIPSAGMYMVRAGEGGVMVARFLKDGVAYIGWGCVGPIAPTDGKAEIRRRLDMYNPAQGAGARPNIVGMLRRFCCEIRMGDVVVTYDPQMRQYHVGIVRSDAEIQMTAWGDGYEELGYVRSVDWARVLPRDCLSRSTRKRSKRSAQLFQGVCRSEAGNRAVLHRAAGDGGGPVLASPSGS